MLTSLLRRLKRSLESKRDSTLQKPSGSKFRRRLWIEELEDRRLLASGLQAISLPNADQPPSDTAAGVSIVPSVSTDGRFVAFKSSAANLVPGQISTPGVDNVFLHDRQTNETVLVSHLPGSPLVSPTSVSLRRDSIVSGLPMISRDGRFVLYNGEEQLFGGSAFASTNNVVVYDRLTRNNTFVSHTPASQIGIDDRDARAEAISADGRFILFVSSARDVIPDYQNTGSFALQLYLYDQETQSTLLVTHVAQQPTQGSSLPVILGATVADDGTVAFVSMGTDLVANTPAGSFDAVYVYDRMSGENQVISTRNDEPGEAAGGAERAIISGDASSVVFVSIAEVLVPNQTSSGFLAARQVYHYNRLTRATRLVSRVPGSVNQGADSLATGSLGFGMEVSRDGRFVAFYSDAKNLVNPPISETAAPSLLRNLYLYDYSSDQLKLVSGILGSLSQPAGGVASALDGAVQSFQSQLFIEDKSRQTFSLSDDGNQLAFVSTATNLVAGQQTSVGFKNIFLFNRTADRLSLVSSTTATIPLSGRYDSLSPVVSGNGSQVLFTSTAPDLIASIIDGNGAFDLFARSTSAGPIALISRSRFQLPTRNGDSRFTSISADGRFSVFLSTATNLVAGQSTLNVADNVYLFDRQTGKVSLINHPEGFANTTGDRGVSDESGRPRQDLAGFRPTISVDGRFVAYVSGDSNLAGGVRDSSLEFMQRLYLYDRMLDKNILVNHLLDAPNITASDARNPVISADGRYIAYLSAFLFTTVPLLRYDRLTDETSDIVDSPLRYTNLSISDDGRFAAYEAQEFTSPLHNVYVVDFAAGTRRLISHAVGSTEAGNGFSGLPTISKDGSAIVFNSTSTNLVQGQSTSGRSSTFVFSNDATGALQLVSRAVGSILTGGNGNSIDQVVSGDGRYVTFESDSTDLISGQVGGGINVYQFDRVAQTQTLISHQAGLPNFAVGGHSPASDFDGHLVTYASTASNLVPGQSGIADVENIFLWVRQTNANVLVSGQNGSPTLTGDANSFDPLITRNSFPAFSSQARLVSFTGPDRSVAYINDLIRLELGPNSIIVGSAANSRVGALNVGTILQGQFQPPTYSLVAGAADNAFFALVREGANTFLHTRFAASSDKTSYSVQVSVVVGFLGDGLGDLTVKVDVPATTPKRQLFVMGFNNFIFGQLLDDNAQPASDYFLTQASAVKSFTVGHDAAGRSLLFVIGGDNQAYSMKFNANGLPAGSYMLTQPGFVQSIVASSDAAGRPLLYAVGLNQPFVFGQRFDQNGTSTGPYFFTQASAVKSLRVGRDATGKPQTFVIGGDNQTYTMRMNADGLPISPYLLAQLGFVRSIDVTNDAAGNILLFAVGLNQPFVFGLRINDQGSAVGPYFLTQASQVKDFTLARDGAGKPQLFVIGLDDQAYTMKLDPTGIPREPYELTRPGFVKSLAATTDSLGRLVLFVVGGDDQVFEQFFDSTGSSRTGYALTRQGKVLAQALTK